MGVSPLDAYASAVQLWLNAYKTNEEIVDLLREEFDVETSEASVRRLIDRHGLEKPNAPKESHRGENPSFEIKGDEATIISDPVTGKVDLGDIESLLRERGLDPEDWIVERVVVNEWEALAFGGKGKQDPVVVTLHQLKVFLKRRFALSFITPAIHIPPVREGMSFRAISRRDSDSILAVIVGDEQEPYSDPILKELFLRFLERNTPEVGVHLGDLLDLPTVSRHKDNPEWAAPVQECINTGYRTLRSYREASPDTKWQLLIGNHDERLRNELLLRAERMYGIRPADTGEEQADEVLSIKNLLHLDALGIEYIAPNGGYAHANVKLSPYLGVRHGWLTGANAASNTLDRLGHSVIVGHTHHQRVHYKTVYDINDEPQILTAVEAGTMARIEGGLGYSINPDWQQGFVTAQIYEDGTFHIDLATYTKGSLYWRDQRYAL